MFGVEQKIERAARKGAAFSAATILASVGLGFLTAAAWMVLSELRSAPFAALVIGIGYLGAAAIAAALGTSKKSKDRHQFAQQDELGSDLTPLQLVALSFLRGFEQGRENSRSS